MTQKAWRAHAMRGAICAAERALGRAAYGDGSRSPSGRKPAGILRTALAAARIAIVATLVSWPAHGTAAPPTDPAESCEIWAAVAAAERGVPERLMIAITRAETGRRANGQRRAWPWAVNVGGEGRWFATRAGALAYAEAHRDAGETRIDLGCFQLNVGWHGRAFDNLDAMLDPARNARYAARFLASLHAEFGDWSKAAAAFHSRTPERGQAYLARLASQIEQLPGPHGPAALPAAPRMAASKSAPPAPLAPRLGSLVPLPGVAAASPLAAFGGGEG